MGIYSDSDHRVVPWELLSYLLVPGRGGNSRMKCFAHPTEVQLGMYSESSHGLVPWERGKFTTEVFGVPEKSAAWQVL